MCYLPPDCHSAPLQPVGNGLDRSVKYIKLRGRTQFAPTSREQPKARSANLPTCWGGGTRKARDGGANHIKIDGRFVNRPYNGAPSRRPLRTKLNFHGRAGACSRRFRPLREGAVKCTAFDWGRDFSVSLPPSFACGKSHLPLRGRGYGSSRTPPLQTGRRVVAPYARIAFLFFNRNGQDRSLQFFIIHFSLFIHFRGAESSPPTLAFQFACSVIQSKPCGGGKPPPYPNPVFRSFQKHPCKPQFTPTTNWRRRITSAAIHNSTFGFI